MSAPATLYHGIDVASLNALVLDIRERLSGGLNGDFYEKGGVIKEGSRHAQLPLLFNAMAQIESLISGMEKQAVITETVETKEAQKPSGKPNKNMMATIKEMVHAEVEAKTRTVTIESERMKAAMQKLETQNGRLVDEVASLKIKVKKGGSQPATGSDEKYNALSKKVDSVQRSQKQYDSTHAGLPRELDALRGAPTRSSNHFAPSLGQTHPTVFGLSERVDDLTNQMQALRGNEVSRAEFLELRRGTSWVIRTQRNYEDEDDEDEDEESADSESY
jgi:hypothetical protein